VELEPVTDGEGIAYCIGIEKRSKEKLHAIGRVYYVASRAQWEAKIPPETVDSRHARSRQRVEGRGITLSNHHSFFAWNYILKLSGKKRKEAFVFEGFLVLILGLPSFLQTSLDLCSNIK
jgi:hypothetical protein